MGRNEKYYIILLFPALLFILAFVAFPIIYNLILSFQDVTLGNLANIFNKPFAGLKNYMAVFRDPNFQNSLNKSCYYLVFSVFFQLVFGLFFAVLFSKEFPFRNFFRGIVLLGWLLPPVVVGTVWRWLLNSDYGVINWLLHSFGGDAIPWLTSHHALAGVTIANIWYGIPFNIALLSGAITGIPGELYEATSIDGANSIQQFFKITLPLIKPTILALLIQTIIFTFRGFALIYAMTGGGPGQETMVLPVWAYKQTFSFFEFGKGAATINIMAILLAIPSYFYSRYSVREEALN